MNHQKPEGLPEKIQLFIGGSSSTPSVATDFDVIEPVTNEVYITAASAQKEDVDLAVAAAKRAFDNGPWPTMLPRERSRILNKVADIVESRDEELAADGELGLRTADHPGDRPGPPRRRELPLLRRPDRRRAR